MLGTDDVWSLTITFVGERGLASLHHWEAVHGPLAAHTDHGHPWWMENTTAAGTTRIFSGGISELWKVKQSFNGSPAVMTHLSRGNGGTPGYKVAGPAAFCRAATSAEGPPPLPASLITSVKAAAARQTLGLQNGLAQR